MQVCVIIPAYNEEKTIREVVRDVHNTECFHAQHSVLCLVVDDGSTDRTAQVAREAGAQVFSHPINRGLGAALSTGIEAALSSLRDGASLSDGVVYQQSIVNSQSLIVVTLDADGQHNPADISRVIEPIVKGEADVVIGTRFHRHNNTECFHAQHSVLDRDMPMSRCIANWCGNLVTWLLFGIWVSDSQSGFRAFSGAVAERLRLRTSTMEVSSEIIREIARLKLRLAQVPITAHYTPYSLSKGQGFFRGLETLWKLIILKFFR